MTIPRLRARVERLRDRRQHGFTLVELLVVITILGILAAIVVFSVAGISDKGQVAAKKTDNSIVRTAEEAYYAKNGSYATMDQLKSGGFIKDASTLSTELFAADGSYFPYTGTTDPAAAGLSTGSTGCGGCTGTGTAIVLAASNLASSGTFLASQFIPSHTSFVLTTGASGTLKTIANTNPGSAGDHSVLFLSADKANADPGVTNVLPGQSAKAYARGQLGIVSCTGATPLVISGVTTSTCAQSSDLATAVTTNKASCLADTSHTQATLTVADVVKLLSTGCDTAQGTGHEINVTMASPGTGCGTTGASAPYGCAGQQALAAAGLSTAAQTTLNTGGRLVYGASDNVGVSLNNLRDGTADVGFTPGSYLIAPSGNEPNAWNLTPTGYDPIMQYGVVLNHGTTAEQTLAKDFLAYIRSTTGQAILSKFGYLPIS